MMKEKKGVTLIELIIVISIIGILATIGFPEYGRFTAKNRVRRATNDLLQNMRLTKTIAIKENRAYLITFNEGVANTYRIGFDGNSNGSLLDLADGYETGPVRVINIQNEYGGNVVLSSANFAINPPNGPNGVVIADPASFNFNIDGSSNPNGIVYLQENNRGYTYCAELANSAGKVDLYMWQGNADDPINAVWTELR